MGFFDGLEAEPYDRTYRDHVFAYPTLNGVIDTIQWEGFREAVDDVRYLTTLCARIAKAKTNAASAAAYCVPALPRKVQSRYCSKTKLRSTSYSGK